MPFLYYKPKYQHNCRECYTLGGCIIDDKTYDLYACVNGGACNSLAKVNLIARYGDKELDYKSMTPMKASLVDKSHPLYVAYDRYRQTTIYTNF